MAWTSPRTWVAGAALSAAQLNAHLRDNLLALLPLDQVAWTSYTPTLTQSAAVAKTVTYAKYQQVGKIVTLQVVLTLTATGTANNKITVTLPVTAASANSQAGHGGYIFDSSGPNVTYPGITVMDSTTTMALVEATVATTNVRYGQTGTSFAVPLATGDVVAMSMTYEAA